MHRIAADGSGKGIGSFCINWAFDQCRHIRIDTHGDNKVMQGMLKKLGFTHCGTVYVEEDDDPRLAFEKSREWVYCIEKPSKANKKEVNEIRPR